ncbi:MAG: hypothetical protein PUC88_04785 [Clostridia bacterium]|nr:hypothetical protein [Clostridia bacterium]
MKSKLFVITSLLIVMIITLSLTGCGSDNAINNGNTDTVTQRLDSDVLSSSDYESAASEISTVDSDHSTSTVSSLTVSSEPEPEQEPEIDIEEEYLNFLKNKSYLDYMENTESSSYRMERYAIMDINADEIPELIISPSESMSPFINYLLFTYNSNEKNVKYVSCITGYDLSHSEKYNCLTYFPFKVQEDFGNLSYLELINENLLYKMNLTWETAQEGKTYRVTNCSGEFDNKPLTSSNYVSESTETVTENDARQNYLDERTYITFTDLP